MSARPEIMMVMPQLRHERCPHSPPPPDSIESENFCAGHSPSGLQPPRLDRDFGAGLFVAVRARCSERPQAIIMMMRVRALPSSETPRRAVLIVPWAGTLRRRATGAVAADEPFLHQQAPWLDLITTRREVHGIYLACIQQLARNQSTALFRNTISAARGHRERTWAFSCRAPLLRLTASRG